MTPGFIKNLLLRPTDRLTYRVAVFSVVLTLLVIELFRHFDETQIFSLGLLPVILVGIFGGRGPVLMCAALAAVGIDFFFVDPIGNAFDSVASFVRVLFFVSTGLVIDTLVSQLRKQLQQTVKDNLKLHKTNDRILAVVAHDIRQPAANITNLCELIAAGEIGNESGGLERQIEMIHYSSVNICRLAQDLVDFAAGSDQNYVVDKKKIDLTLLLQSVVNRCGITAENKEIYLEFVNRLQSSDVMGDALRLEQVVQNLISNAIKFSMSGTTVKVVLEPVDDRVCISVSDQGPGISEEEIPKLFLPYQHLSNRPTAGEPSTGLGMTIVKSIVDAHGAEISVASKVGEGTCFTVKLGAEDVIPLDEAEVANLRLTGKSDRPDKGLKTGAGPQADSAYDITALLVDDDRISRTLAARLLSKMGMKIIEAGDGVEALKQVQTENIDLILMDCEMPNMNGYEATEQIRKLEGFRGKMPVFGLTAHAFPEATDRCLKAGMNAVIQKPLRGEQLQIEMRAHFQARVDKVS